MLNPTLVRPDAMGLRVRLRTFNGTISPQAGCRAAENYWMLIGEEGEVIEPPNERGRVCVRFDKSMAGLGLHSHNVVPDSLFILASDLEPVS